MQNKWRAYIKPFDDNGNYTSFVECTEDIDISAIGGITQNLDNTDYDIGIYRVANIGVRFRNDSGKYSDVGGATSIFRYKRGGSLFKVTWEINSPGFICGQSKCGIDVLSQETTVFQGVINDESVVMDLDSRELSMQVLGRESVLDSTSVPFDSIVTLLQTATMTVASPCVITTASPHGLVVGNPIYFTTTGTLPDGINSKTPYYVSVVLSSTTFRISQSLNGGDLNTGGTQSGVHSIYKLFGQTLSSLLLTLLNQAPITKVLTVSAGTIAVGTDFALDSIVDYQNKTVKDAIDELLMLSNSVLYVQNDGITIAPRTATAAVQFNFYGQASPNGPENVQNIKGIKAGLSRVFNYLSWTPSGTLAYDISSTTKYGAKTKSFNQACVSTPANQQTVLNNILSEFYLPKQEFDLYTPMDYKTLAINLLDRVQIDYPTVLVPGDFPFPICGQAICGHAVLPRAQWGFTITTVDNYKVIGKEIDAQNGLVKLRMRKI